MRPSEWVIFAYFAYLLACTAIQGRTARVLVRVAGPALLVTAVVLAVAGFEPSPVAGVLRDWLPGGYLLLGYWATGALYRGPNLALEARLLSIDDRVRTWLTPLVGREPRVVAELLEGAYLFCYPLVPAGLAVLYLSGHRVLADRYWVLVLAATFTAYGVLPWLGTRPPRALGSPHWSLEGPALFRRLNLAVLGHGSIHVNTFPSGHAASAWSAALFLTTVPGSSWVAFMAVAAGIAAGAIAGRYHYAVDVAAGIAVAFAAFVLLVGGGR